MKRLYKFHSWLGLIAGLGLLVIGLTGSVLVFKDELDRLLIPGLVTVKQPLDPALSLDSLLTEFRLHLPGYEMTGWLPPAEPGLSGQVFAKAHGEKEGKLIYVNPATGEPLANPMEWNASVMNWLLELHYTLLGDHVGAFIAGLFALGLCLLGVTGVWLYRGFWKTLFLLRWRRSLRIFLSDLHKMVGITSTAFNLILGFTGAYWNLTHIIGHWIEGPEPEPVKMVGPAFELPLDDLLSEAQSQIPGFQLRFLSLPETTGGPIMLMGCLADQHIFRSPYGSTVSFDSKTGAITDVVDSRKAGPWAQFVDSFSALHFGNFGGWPVKILWCLGGLSPGILAVSGAMMYFKRSRIGKKRFS